MIFFISSKYKTLFFKSSSLNPLTSTIVGIFDLSPKYTFISSCCSFTLKKKYFGKNTDCDFLSSYVAYMTWYLKYGKEYLPKIKENNIEIINYKTSNLNRSSKKYKEEKNFLIGKCLDGRILKDVLKTEIDLKKRLNRLGYYEFQSLNENPILFNINNEDVVNLFKYAICGSFYKQIFKPHYTRFNRFRYKV